jgi:two-component system, sensor histidine kinase FlrB
MNTPNLQYQQKTERLTDAFRVFNELSENLASSYQGLQEQVANLNRQLAAARNERLTTLIEKEKLASR